MLILTRRPHETIRIANRIRVTVLGFKGNQVRIGIEAPPDVTIDREEVWVRKRQEGRSESRDGPPDPNEQAHEFVISLPGAFEG